MSSSSSNSNRRAKMEKEREKQVQDRLQVLICEMLKDEDNKYCVDCDSKGLSNDSGLVKSYFWQDALVISTLELLEIA